MSKNARKSKTRSKAKVRSKKVGAHGKVDRRRTVQHRGKTLFLLKGGSEINPCAGKEDGTSWRVASAAADKCTTRLPSLRNGVTLFEFGLRPQPARLSYRCVQVPWPRAANRSSRHWSAENENSCACGQLPRGHLQTPAAVPRTPCISRRLDVAVRRRRLPDGFERWAARAS
jgi:hypothetical protein